jgi:S1-C subfamily serine protease
MGSYLLMNPISLPTCNKLIPNLATYDRHGRLRNVNPSPVNIEELIKTQNINPEIARTISSIGQVSVYDKQLKEYGSGTCYLIAKGNKGLIFLTNDHVLLPNVKEKEPGAWTIHLPIINNDEHEVKYRRVSVEQAIYDKQAGLGFLVVSGSELEKTRDLNLEPLTFAKDGLKVDDLCFSIGYPGPDLNLTLTSGIVTSPPVTSQYGYRGEKRGEITTQSGKSISGLVAGAYRNALSASMEGFIRGRISIFPKAGFHEERTNPDVLDASYVLRLSAKPGNSGGPIFDKDGRVVATTELGCENLLGLSSSRSYNWMDAAKRALFKAPLVSTNDISGAIGNDTVLSALDRYEVKYKFE